jgi:hypothetical protein
LVVLSSKVGRKRKKKESGDSSESGIRNCGLLACCSQPALAVSIIYADLWGELSTHLVPQGFLLRVLLCGSLCYRLSPFQALGKVTLPPCCHVCVFIYSSCGWWVFPSSCAVFLPLPLSQAFLLLLTGRCYCSCQLPCLFTVHVGSGSSLLSCGVFLSLPLSQAFPLLVAGHAPFSCQRLSCLPGLFIYSLFTVPGRIPFPQSSVLSVPHPLSSVS